MLQSVGSNSILDAPDPGRLWHPSGTLLGRVPDEPAPILRVRVTFGPPSGPPALLVLVEQAAPRPSWRWLPAGTALGSVLHEPAPIRAGALLVNPSTLALLATSSPSCASVFFAMYWSILTLARRTLSLSHTRPSDLRRNVSERP